MLRKIMTTVVTGCVLMFMAPVYTQASNVIVDGRLGVGTETPSRQVHVQRDGAVIYRLQDISASGYFDFINVNNPTVKSIRMNLTSPEGEALIDINPMPTDNESLASFRFFRTTNTSGQRRIDIHRGDGTAARSAQIGADTTATYFGVHGGFVGIGTSSPAAPLDVQGTTNLRNNVSIGGDLNVAGETVTSVLEITGGSDLSERFEITGGLAEPGTVVSIDPINPGALRVAGEPYDRTVAGIVSGAGGLNPGMLMGQSGSIADGAHPVALTGRVWAMASGPIQVGDLLTTSELPGHAMAVRDYGRAQGAVLGKAMTGLDQGTGLVLVLVSLQ